jgi:hypothetical protein
VTEITLLPRVRGKAPEMRKLTLLLVAMLTTASPAWASGGAPPTAPDAAAPATDDPATDDPASDDPAPTSYLPDIPQRTANQLNRDDVRDLQRSNEAARSAAVAVSPQLQAIAQCESGGDPGAVGGGGQFRGKYQFTYATWAAVGGHGDPAAAPEAEQDRRAAALYEQSGPGQWPVCGQ